MLYYTLILNFISYYSGIGLLISFLYSLMVFTSRDKEVELKFGEIMLTIFFYPFIIYQLTKTYKNGK